MSILGDIADGIGSLFGGGDSSSSGSSGGGFLSQLGDSLFSPEGVKGILTAGTALLQSQNQLDAADKAQARTDATTKMNQMIELAKLKYQFAIDNIKASQGLGGRRYSGGGSGAAGLAAQNQARANLITAIGNQQAGISNSLTALGSGLGKAYGGR